MANVTHNIDIASTIKEVALSDIRWIAGANNARISGIRGADDTNMKTLIQSMALNGWLKNEGTIQVLTAENAEAIGLNPENLYVPEGIEIPLPDDNGKVIKHKIADSNVQNTSDILYVASPPRFVAIDGYHRFTAWMLANSYREKAPEIPTVAIEVVMVDDLKEFYQLQMSDNRRAAVVQTTLWEILNDCLIEVERGGGEISLYTGKPGELPPCKNKAMASGMYAMAMCYLKIKQIGDDPTNMEPFDAIKEAEKAGWLPDQKFRNMLNKYLKEVCGVPDRMRDALSEQKTKNLVAGFIRRGPDAPAPSACWKQCFDAAFSNHRLDLLKKYCKEGNVDMAIEQLLEIDNILLEHDQSLKQEQTA